MKSILVSMSLLAVVLLFAESCSPIKDHNSQMIGKKTAADYYKGYNYQRVSPNQYKYLTVSDVTLQTIAPDRKISAGINILLYDNGTYDLVYDEFRKCAVKSGVIFEFNPVFNSGTWSIKGQTLYIGDLGMASPSDTSATLTLFFRKDLRLTGLNGKSVTFIYAPTAKSLDDLRMQNFSLSTDSPDACR